MCEIIWASTREVFNVVRGGRDGLPPSITAPADILKKLPAMGSKSAAELSLSAPSRRSARNALAAGLSLAVPPARAAE